MLIRASEPRAPPCSARIRAFAPSSAPELVDVRPASSAGPRRGVAIIAPAAFRPRRFGLPYVRKNRAFGNPALPAPRCGKLPTWGFAARDRGGGAPRRRNGGKDCQKPDFSAHRDARTRRRGRFRPTPRPEAGPRNPSRALHAKGGVRTNVSRETFRAPTPRATPLSHNEATPARRTRRGRYRRSMRLRTRPRAPPRRRWRARGARLLRRWRPPP